MVARVGPGALLIALALAAACPPPVPASRCADDQDCPEGYTCADPPAGACVREVTAADAPTCGGTSVFRDDFDLQQPGVWFDSCDENTVRQGGTLLLEVDDTGGSNWASCWSGFTADLREDRVNIKVAQPPDPNLPVAAYLEVNDGPNFWIGMGLEGGTLRADAELGTTTLPEPMPSVPFDGQRHLYWQIREHAGVVYLETSPDRDAWEELWHWETPAWAEGAYLLLGAWVDQGSGASGAVRFDELNTDRPAASWCPTATVQQGFDEEELPYLWRRGVHYDDPLPCDFSIVSSELRMRYRGDASGEQSGCYLFTGSAFTLAESEVLVEVTELPPAAFEAGLSLWESWDRYISFTISGGDLVAYAEPSSWEDPYFTPDPVPAEGRTWLRVRQEEIYTYFEARADGEADWDPIWRSEDIPPFTAASVELQLMLEDRSTPLPWPEAAAQFDNLNLP